MQHDERILLAVALDKKYIKRIAKHRKTMSEQGKALLTCLENYHKTHDEWDLATFRSIYEADNCNRDSEQIDQAIGILEAAEEYLEEDDCATLLDKYHNYDIADKAQTMLMTGLNSDDQIIEEVISDVRVLLDDTAAVYTKGIEEDLNQGSIEDLMHQAFRPGLQWRMPELNARIGDLRPDQHCNFAARPGTGKTSFIADSATWMARQLEEDQSVVWFGNEEAASRLRRRMLTSAIGRTITANENPILLRQEYEEAVRGHFDNRVIICRPEHLTDSYIIEAIEWLAKKGRRPGLIIIDQIMTLDGFQGKQNEMEARYIWARSLPVIYDAPVISVHQLAKMRGQMNLEGMLTGLTKGDLHGSKTDAPGACDLMLALGAPIETETDFRRCINVTKTKELSGSMLDKDKEKQDLFVLLQPSIGRYVAQQPENINEQKTTTIDQRPGGNVLP